MVEGPHEPRVRGPVVHLDEALLEVGRQHLTMAVGAAVVVQEEALGPDQPMELDPLRQVGGVVAVHRAHR
jgi:hypothetical protein